MQEFRVEQSGNEKKAVVNNVREVTGPREIKLVMHTDVRRRIGGEPLAYRYVYEFYIHVGNRNF